MKKLIICLFIFITLFEAASFAEDAAVLGEGEREGGEP